MEVIGRWLEILIGVLNTRIAKCPRRDEGLQEDIKRQELLERWNELKDMRYNREMWAIEAGVLQALL